MSTTGMDVSPSDPSCRHARARRAGGPRRVRAALAVGIAALTLSWWAAPASANSASANSASAPSASASSSGARSGVPADGAPVRWVAGAAPREVGSDVEVASANWAGLVEQGGPLTEVQGNWSVPSVQPTPDLEVSATWIGIDGVSTRSLIQTGTVQETQGEVTRYYAWYELLPADAVDVFAVDPGDAIEAVISQISTDQWSITIEDSTLGRVFSAPVSYDTPGDSAEWIEEDPTSAATNQLETLADFGAVGFSDIGYSGPGAASATATETYMVNEGGQSIAYPADVDLPNESFAIFYGAPSSSPPPTTPGGGSESGYDLVGRDGGVFVFPTGATGGFYGSLPGIGVRVDDIVGMVPSAGDGGYFLVGSDGGVFAFGDAPFEGSLPGIGVRVDDIVGIVPTADDEGYFLVGSDGGVFAFGDASYLGSLPGEGVHVDDVIGIAATPNVQGYWVVASDGTVYAFGQAPNFGSAVGTGSQVSGIAATPDGGGYWIVTRDGGVIPFGDAAGFGSLPAIGVMPSHPVIGLVPTADHQGYWLIGSDGGVFAFGDAPYVGSLPGLGVDVTDIVGAVPTTP